MYGSVEGSSAGSSFLRRSGRESAGILSRDATSNHHGEDLSNLPHPVHIQAHQRPKKQNHLKKELGFISITALTLNDMMGAGVLIAPSLIFQYTGSFGLSIVLWLVGGVITTVASWCYLELALLVKKSGSTYVYIKEAYSFGRTKPWMEGVGSVMSFLMVWTDIVIIEPLSAAIAYLAIGRYACRPFFIDCQEMPIYAVKMFGLFALVLLTIVNVYSVKVVARLLTWLSSLKFLVFAFIVALAIWKLIQCGSFPEDSKKPFEGSSTSFSDITLGLYGVMWAYDGWTAGFMVQEEAKGTRAVKWMVYVSLPIVTVVYLLLNTAFFAVLSYDQIYNSKAVGLLFGQVTLGTAGVIIFSIICVILTLGSSEAGQYERSRELFVASREGDMPKFLSGIHVTYRTPIQSLVLQNAIVAVYIMAGSLENLLNVFNAAEWFWYGVGIFGLIIMRHTLPDKHRPFKVILLLPSVMVVVCILLVVLPLWQDPLPQLLGFAGVLAGLPVYAIFVMEKPWRLKPKIFDRIGDWLIDVTGKLFNTELSDAF